MISRVRPLGLLKQRGK
jgi:transposase